MEFLGVSCAGGRVGLHGPFGLFYLWVFFDFTREGQMFLVPTSSPVSHLQGIPSAGFNPPEPPPGATSIPQGHLPLQGLVLLGEAEEEQDKALGCPAEPRMRISGSHRDLPAEERTSPAGLDLLDTSKPTQQPWHKSLGKRETLHPATSIFFHIDSGPGCYGLSA